MTKPFTLHECLEKFILHCGVSERCLEYDELFSSWSLPAKLSSTSLSQSRQKPFHRKVFSFIYTVTAWHYFKTVSKYVLPCDLWVKFQVLKVASLKLTYFWSVVTCSLVETDLLSEALSASIIRSNSPAQYPRRQVRFITSRSVQKLQFLKTREDAPFQK